MNDFDLDPALIPGLSLPVRFQNIPDALELLACHLSVPTKELYRVLITLVEAGLIKVPDWK